VTEPTRATGSGTKASPRPGPGRPRGAQGPAVHTGSPDARRLAAALLEVLAGVRTPTDAAAALGCSLPRYYACEVRALEGFVAACESRRPGRTASPEREVATLRQTVARQDRERGRLLALLRAAQRTVGLAAAKPHPKPIPGKRPRRPTVRALAAAKRLATVPAVSPSPLPPVSPTPAVPERSPR
jgi:hypothetical protein